MSRDENPPFERGETFYAGGTIDTADLGGLNLEGQEWVFNDESPTGDTTRTNKYVRCRVVRNSSGINLLPKRIAAFEVDATNPNEWGNRVAGYTTTGDAEGYPIDEYLPAAGVPDNDLFWIVVEGPAVVLTSLTDLTAVVGGGDWMNAITAATSQATTAGRVTNQVVSDAGVLNRIGRALSAATTANTDTDLLIEVGKW